MILEKNYCNENFDTFYLCLVGKFIGLQLFRSDLLGDMDQVC